MRFTENVRNGTRNRLFNFGGNLDQCLYPGIFKGYFISALIGNIGSVGPWQRYVLSKCYCLLNY